MKLRLVGISSSHREGKSTDYLVNYTLECAKAKILELEPSAEVEVEFVGLSKKNIKPCTDCGGCKRMGTLCILKDDWLECVDPLINPCPPDGLVIGSPVYFHSTNSQMRAFMERFTCLFKKLWHPEHPVPASDFTKTVAGALSVGLHRNGGVEEAISNIISFLCSCGCIVVSSFDQMSEGPIGYTGATGWNGNGVESIMEDEWGMRSAKALGERIGETALIVKKGKCAVQ